MIEATTDARLFARFGSARLEEELALFVMDVPPALVLVSAVIVTVTVPLLATVPAASVTKVLLVVRVPCDVVAETSVSPAGNASVTVSDVAEEGPRLVTMMVNTALLPATTAFVAIV